MIIFTYQLHHKWQHYVLIAILLLSLWYQNTCEWMNCFICTCLFSFECISKLIHFFPDFIFIFLVWSDNFWFGFWFDTWFVWLVKGTSLTLGEFSFFLSASFNLCFLWLTFFFLICLTAFDLPAACIFSLANKTKAKGNLESAKTRTDPVRNI